MLQWLGFVIGVWAARWRVWYDMVFLSSTGKRSYWAFAGGGWFSRVGRNQGMNGGGWGKYATSELQPHCWYRLSVNKTWFRLVNGIWLQAFPACMARDYRSLSWRMIFENHTDHTHAAGGAAIIYRWVMDTGQGCCRLMQWNWTAVCCVHFLSE